MKTIFLARQGLAVGAALILHQSAVAIPTASNYDWDPVTQKAKRDLGSAYLGAAGQPSTVSHGAVQQLGGLTLPAGTFNSSSLLGTPGTLTLAFLSDPTAVRIFQPGSAPTTTAGSAVQLISGAQGGNLVWVVSGSAPPGAGATFQGDILALSYLTLNPGATGDDRLPGGTGGAVNFDISTISQPAFATIAGVPEAGSTVFLFAFGSIMLLVFGAKFQKRGASLVVPSASDGWSH